MSARPGASRRIARVLGYVSYSAKISRPCPYRVEMKIGNVDVPDPDRVRGRVSRIRRPAAMEFVAASVGQGEGLAPIPD